MSWNNVLLLSAGMFLFSGIAQAEKINCPETLKESNKTYTMNYVSLFMGPPEEKGFNARHARCVGVDIKGLSGLCERT
jgi:hypothetical protein